MQKKIGLFIAPLLALIIINMPSAFIDTKADKVIALAVWMVLWWITEAVPIAVTSLLPLLLFPVLNIMPLAETGANYGSPIIFLFFGGFVLALALEKVKLHKRIALSIIKKTGTTPHRVVLGFMVATAFLSMWISNTASTVVMLPMAISVIGLLANVKEGLTSQERNFALSLMLGIAFSANAGGIATLIGTPPNSVLIGLLENEFNIQISFLKWMCLGLPFSIIMVTLCYWILVHWMYPCKNLSFQASAKFIETEITSLGKLSKAEKIVLSIFLSAVFLWVFRSSINRFFPGLKITDTFISLLAAISLFVVPLNYKTGTSILNWDDTKKLAWGILLLFGGGLALANGMKDSGLVDLVSEGIAQQNFNPSLTIFLLIALMLFMTELMSNVALVSILAPVIAGIALGLNLPLLHVLIPITMASSCAFMLPMATPPNAIVFASGYVKVKQMARVGILLNCMAIVLLFLYFYWVIPYLI